MNRRAFMQALTLGGSASLSAARGAWALISPPDAMSTRRLIVVFMRGAVDGLSLVVPYNERNYYGLRSKRRRPTAPRPSLQHAINIPILMSKLSSWSICYHAGRHHPQPLA
jgi:uncharacterized protein (DUF1501 family)